MVSATADASVFDETEVLRMWILLVSGDFCIEITITSYF